MFLLPDVGDIIIERWLPYGPPPARQTIVRPPALATKYPEPRNIIEIYESVQMRTVRRFQKSGPTRESPEEYLHRYGGSLLDSEKLIQEARHLGVYEDLVMNHSDVFEGTPMTTTTLLSILVITWTIECLPATINNRH